MNESEDSQPEEGLNAILSEIRLGTEISVAFS